MVYVPRHKDFGPGPFRGLARTHNVFLVPKLGVLGCFSKGSREPIFDTRDLIFGSQLSLLWVMKILYLNLNFSKIFIFVIFWTLVFTFWPIYFFLQGDLKN